MFKKGLNHRFLNISESKLFLENFLFGLDHIWPISRFLLGAFEIFIVIAIIKVQHLDNPKKYPRSWNVDSENAR